MLTCVPECFDDAAETDADITLARREPLRMHAFAQPHKGRQRGHREHRSGDPHRRRHELRGGLSLRAAPLDVSETEREHEQPTGRHAAGARDRDPVADEFDEELDEELVEEPGVGPYDVSDAPSGVQRIDLGSLQLLPVEGVEGGAGMVVSELPKPFDLEELLDQVGRFVGRGVSAP